MIKSTPLTTSTMNTATPIKNTPTATTTTPNPIPTTPNNATSSSSSSQRQIPIVCPGHTRPLAELQFISIPSDSANKEDTPPTLTNESETQNLKGSMQTFLISACHDRLPMLRNGTTGDWIGTFTGHKGAVWSACLDSAGYLSATASGDYSIKIWDAINGEYLFGYDHEHIMKSVKFSLDSMKLASGGHEGLLRIYDLKHKLINVDKKKKDSSGKDVDNDNNGEEVVTIPIMATDDEGNSRKVVITKVEWLNNNVVLAACSDGFVRFYEINTKMLLRKLNVEAEVRDMEISRSPVNMLTVAAGDKVYFFNIVESITNSGDDNNNIQPESPLYSHKMPINFINEGGASLHPSGLRFVAGGSDLWVRVFETKTGDQLECHRGHHGPVRCVRYAPDGKTYATGSEDGTVRLWRTDP